jgi:hypothetical protein
LPSTTNPSKKPIPGSVRSVTPTASTSVSTTAKSKSQSPTLTASLPKKPTPTAAATKATAVSTPPSPPTTTVSTPPPPTTTTVSPPPPPPPPPPTAPTVAATTSTTIAPITTIKEEIHESNELSTIKREPESSLQFSKESLKVTNGISDTPVSLFPINDTQTLSTSTPILLSSSLNQPSQQPEQQDTVNTQNESETITLNDLQSILQLDNNLNPLITSEKIPSNTDAILDMKPSDVPGTHSLSLSLSLSLSNQITFSQIILFIIKIESMNGSISTKATDSLDSEIANIPNTEEIKENIPSDSSLIMSEAHPNAEDSHVETAQHSILIDKIDLNQKLSKVLTKEEEDALLLAEYEQELQEQAKEQTLFLSKRCEHLCLSHSFTYLLLYLFLSELIEIHFSIFLFIRFFLSHQFSPRRESGLEPIPEGPEDPDEEVAQQKLQEMKRQGN